MNYVDASLAGMTSWTDPHVMQMPGFGGFGRCAAVYWASVILSLLVVMLVFYGFKKQRGKERLILQLLLGVALILAALKPLLEFFGPALHSIYDQDTVEALLHRTVSWEAIACYVASCGGLALLCYLAMSERPSTRGVLFWLIAPLTIGVAFIVVGGLR